MRFPLTFSTQYSDQDWPKITAWLADCYWSPGIVQQRVEQAAQASTLVVGAFIDGQQIGYARIISDTVRFAYLADVYVDAAYRGRGIAQQLTQQLLSNPILQGVHRTLLLTADAHGVYEKLGFTAFPNPEKLMVHHNPNALDYTQAAA